MIHSQHYVPLIRSAQSHSGSLLSFHTLHYRSLQSSPTMPNYAGGFPSNCSTAKCQNPHWNALPQPQECQGLPRSCGHHVMIMQPCATGATSLADPLASGPGTWGVQPSLFSTLFLSYGMLILC